MIGSDLVISKFVEQIDQRFNTKLLQSFWECTPYFQALIDSGEVVNTINSALSQLVENPAYIGDWPASQLMLHRSQGYALSVALFSTPRRYIHTTPFMGMYAPINDVSLAYDLYDLPDNYENSVFDPTHRLIPAGSASVAPGEVLAIQPGFRVYDFRVDRPLLVLKFTTSPLQALQWLFSRENLQPLQANDAFIKWTQLRVAAFLLGRLGDSSSVEALTHVAGHANPVVRWAGIQNLGRISRAAAIGRLKEAADDPHPHLRQAARKTLDRLRTPLKD